jgi:hypothetical protein
MMAQREILEAQFQRYRQESPTQFVSIAGRFDDPGELQRHRMQLHRPISRPRAASQAAGFPAIDLSPLLAPAGGTSRRRPANEAVDLQQHIPPWRQIKAVDPARLAAHRACP